MLMSEGFTFGRNAIGISVWYISLDLYQHWHPSSVVADWYSNSGSNRLTTYCIPVPLEYWCAEVRTVTVLCVAEFEQCCLFFPTVNLTIYPKSFQGFSFTIDGLL